MGVLDAVVHPVIRASVVNEPGWSEVLSPPGVTVTGTTGTSITGWGFPCGSPRNFKRVSFDLRNSVAGQSTTLVRVRIKEGSSTGALLADKTVSTSLTLNVTSTVTVTFDSEVANASGTALWCEIITNARIDEFKLLVDAYASPTAKYWTGGSVTSPSGSPATAVSQRNYPVTFWAEDSSVFEPALSSEMAALIERDTVLSRMVTPTYGLTPDLVLGATTTTAMATSSTFSAWGQYVGNISTPFNAVSFYLYAFNSAAIPTQCRVIARRMPADSGQWNTNPSTWQILADTTFNVTPAESTYTKVTARFDPSAQLTGHIWIEYLTNGREGGMTNGVTATGEPGRWYATNASISTFSWVKAVANLQWYIELGRQGDEVVSFAVTDEFKQQLGSVPTVAGVTIHLPATLYALEGREMNIYAKNVIRSGADIEGLDVNFGGTKGAQYGAFGGFWRYTPTAGDAGTSTLSITVTDTTSNTVLATASASLVTRALTHPTVAVSRRLLCIGDSTMGGGGAAVLAELVNLFNGDAQYALTLVGSNDGNYNDSGAVSRAVRCDAISGWTVAMFSTDAATAWTEIGGTARTGSPFVYSGAFNFTTYKSTHSVTLSSGDWVLINLGINDLFGYTDDVNVSAKMETMITQMEAMITSIQASTAGIRIVVCTMIPPPESQDAFVVYGVGQTVKRYKRNRDLWVERVLSQFGGRTASNIHVLSYGSSLDTVNNFGAASVAVNARNATTYSQPVTTTGVHPATSGYYQLADTIRSFLKAIES